MYVWVCGCVCFLRAFLFIISSGDAIVGRYTLYRFSEGAAATAVAATAGPVVYSVFVLFVLQSSGGSRTVADAVLVMPPHSSFGGFQDERGTEAFLRKALKGCRLPVFLYSAAGEI